MIAANLPDVDVLVFVTDTPPVAFRRGWTHGVIAQALLPVLLTLIFVMIDRRRPSPARRRRLRPAHRCCSDTSACSRMSRSTG